MMRKMFAAVSAFALTGCGAAAVSEAPAPAAPAAAPAAPAEPQVPKTMQWLYGSGEGGAVSIQTYHAFREHVLAAVRQRPRESVVLTPDSTLAAPRFVPCGDKPLAVVLDVDETAVQNLGLEYQVAMPGADERALLRRWHESEGLQTQPMPGAVTALQAVRSAGVKVIYNTGRDNEHAARTAATLNRIGLGPAVHLDNLFLRGDPPGDPGKDGRRTLLAERYCIVAMAGDQLGDFSELFNERGLGVRDRRRAAITQPFARLWGNGWYLLSNPVYGPGLRGGFDDVFPADVRWSPAGGN